MKATTKKQDYEIKKEMRFTDGRNYRRREAVSSAIGLIT
jgi:hypothetical protein